MALEAQFVGPNRYPPIGERLLHNGYAIVKMSIQMDTRKKIVEGQVIMNLM